jgi:hypothetical protein
MPSVTAYKRGFGVTKGTSIGRFVVDNIKVDHVVKERNRRYEYLLQYKSITKA